MAFQSSINSVKVLKETQIESCNNHPLVLSFLQPLQSDFWKKKNTASSMLAFQYQYPTTQQLVTFVRSISFPQNLKYTIKNNNNTCLMAICPGLSGWAGIRKAKPIWIYWSKRLWVAVASARPYANLHLTTQFFTATCPSCLPTSSVKSLQAQSIEGTSILYTSRY